MSNWVQMDGDAGPIHLWEDDMFTLQVQPADDGAGGWVYLVTGPDPRERSMETMSGHVRPDEGDVEDAMEVAEAVLRNEFGVDPEDYRDEFTASKDPSVEEYTVGYKQGFTDALREASGVTDTTRPTAPDY